MKKIAVLSVLILFMVFASGAQAAIITTYPDAFDMNAASPLGLLVENFNDGVLNLPGLSLSETGGAGIFALGTYGNIVDDSPLRNQIFTYAPGMRGFGAWFDLTPGGPGLGINVIINNIPQLAMTIPNTASGQFYGFLSDTTFTSIMLAAGTQGGQDGQDAIRETYRLVDLAVAPVPIPAPILLLGAGLMGLVGLRKRFNK